ncbi:MAG TPA: TadE/TadG family type IV pilus assembly protein [Gaiellaceae bacterium]|nr:TadE/TadG family type IV pilus assembly protein [Gaiellaceae bacterium]
MRIRTQPVSGARGGNEARALRSKAESAPTCRRARSERGQAAVEFALVVPFICLLVLALVDFGKGVNYWLDANHLASEGARLAAVLGDQPQPGGDIKQWIQQQAETSELRNGTGSVTSPARVCISFPDGRQIGKPVTVTVTATYRWIPFIGGGTFDISGSSTMRLEQLPTYADGCT